MTKKEREKVTDRRSSTLPIYKSTVPKKGSPSKRRSDEKEREREREKESVCEEQLRSNEVTNGEEGGKRERKKKGREESIPSGENSISLQDRSGAAIGQFSP